MEKIKNFFAIYIYEHEDGRITVKSDHSGEGYNSLQIGISILEDLKDIEAENQGNMIVEHITYSPLIQ